MLRDSRHMIRRLTESGFTLVSVRGSHHKYRNVDNGRIVILPHPRKDIPVGTVRSAKQVGASMYPPHFIALIHKEQGSGYGVSFPDVPGVVAMGDDLDEALAEARVALAFAFEDWAGALPKPRSLEDLRRDERFVEDAKEAVVAAVLPHEGSSQAAE